jgi:hypothetical protein
VVYQLAKPIELILRSSSDEVHNVAGMAVLMLKEMSI